jgi:hypothetical protein
VAVSPGDAAAILFFTSSLRLVHRDICDAHQRGRSQGQPVRHWIGRGDPYRGAQRPLSSVLRDQRSNSLGECERGDFRGPRRYDRELVAPPACTDIRRAQLGADDGGQATERFVTGAVAIAVVDAFETIQVDEQKRERFAVSSRPCEFPIQTVEQAPRVREASERICFG